MPCFIAAQIFREGVGYLPFITADVAKPIAGIVEDVHGLWAWNVADLAVVPMVVAVGFPIGAVPMATLAGKTAYLARGITFHSKGVLLFLNVPTTVGAGIPVPVVIPGQDVGDAVGRGIFF